MARQMDEEEDREIRYGILLSIVSVIMVAGALSPWFVAEGERYMALATWYYAPMAFAGGFISLFGSIVFHRIYRIGVIQKYRPYTDGIIGLVGSVLSMTGVILFFTLHLDATGHSPAYGSLMTLGAAIVGIFASVGVFKKSSPQIPKSSSNKKKIPRLGD